MRNGQLIPTLSAQAGITAIAFSSNDKTLASASEDKSIKLWGPEKGELLRTLLDLVQGVTSVSLSPQAQTFASGSNR